jgi:hypothetical protein
MSAQAIADLRSEFHGVDDEMIRCVLAECSNDIAKVARSSMSYHHCATIGILFYIYFSVIFGHVTMHDAMAVSD